MPDESTRVTAVAWTAERNQPTWTERSQSVSTTYEESGGSARAFALCERVATEQTRATGAGPYADGFRAAGYRIARQIAQLQKSQPLTALERDLRDVEVEAHTLARVVCAAERVLDDIDEDSDGAETLRVLLGLFFDPEDLPRRLRGARDSFAPMESESDLDSSHPSARDSVVPTVPSPGSARKVFGMR